MKERIHTLQHQLRTVENMLDNLTGPMLELALEEVNNLNFELEMLNRTMDRTNKEHLVSEEHLEEQGQYA